jgi:hypothetical protein
MEFIQHKYRHEKRLDGRGDYDGRFLHRIGD